VRLEIHFAKRRGGNDAVGKNAEVWSGRGGVGQTEKKEGLWGWWPRAKAAGVCNRRKPERETKKGCAWESARKDVRSGAPRKSGGLRARERLHIRQKDIVLTSLC